MKSTREDGLPYGGSAGSLTRPPAPPVTPQGEGGGPAPKVAAGSPPPAARPGRPVNRAVVLSLLRLASVIVLLTAGVALAGALVWPKTYTARAEVLYPITQEQPTGFLREDRSLTTQLVLIKGRPVLAPIAGQQGRTVEELQRLVGATVVDSSEIIQVEVGDRSADRALQTTQAVLDGYLALSSSTQPARREGLEADLATANTALADAQARLTAQQNQPGAAADTLASLRAAVQTQQARQQQLRDQLDAVDIAPVPRLLTPPYLAEEVTPRPLYVTVTGALVGLVLAAGVVAVAARSRKRE